MGQELNQMREKLLKNRRVIEEIKRHLWIESEKAGYDIGFEKAADDWLKNFSKAWMEYHIPKQKSPARRMKAASKTSTSQTSK